MNFFQRIKQKLNGGKPAKKSDPEELCDLQALDETLLDADKRIEKLRQKILFEKAEA